jgi:hypothetical protein
VPNPDDVIDVVCAWVSDTHNNSPIWTLINHTDRMTYHPPVHDSLPSRSRRNSPPCSVVFIYGRASFVNHEAGRHIEAVALPSYGSPWCQPPHYGNG